MNTYFLFQFGYCSLVWMNHRRILNNRINGLHERPLRLLYSNFSLTSSELLIKDNQRNLPTLLYQMFKLQNSLAPEIMKNIFPFQRLPYNLKGSTTLPCGST